MMSCNNAQSLYTKHLPLVDKMVNTQPSQQWMIVVKRLTQTIIIGHPMRF